MEQIATFITAATFTGTSPVTLTSTDAGATAGPILTLYRNSASPAASDIIGKVRFQGEDSAGNTEDYAEIYPTIDDPTSTSEDASLVFRAKVAGTMTTLLTLNASQQPRLTKSFVSSNQTITAAGTLTIAHGLGTEQMIIQAELVCTTDNVGYVAGAVIPIGLGSEGSDFGVVVRPDSTNLNVVFGSAAGVFKLLNAANGNTNTITAASWRIRFRCLA